MEKELTLTLDENLIEHARQHAQKKGITPDQLIAKFIEFMDHRSDFGHADIAVASSPSSLDFDLFIEVKTTPERHPIIGLLQSSGSDDSEDYKELISDYLAERDA